MLDLRKALAEAKRLESAGRLQDAGTLYRKILQGAPGNVAARQGLTRLSAARGAGGRGTDPLDRLRQLYRAGDFQGAAREAERQAKKTPGQPMLHMLRGAAEMELGQPARAAEAFRKVARLTPDRPAGHANLGMALRALGRTEEARAAFECALEKDPRYAPAWNNLGILYHDSGDLPAARAAFERAVELTPKDAELLTNLGNIHLAGGETDQAVALYRRALAADPGHAGTHYNLARALRTSGDIEEVVGHYRAAIRAQPGFAGAHLNLGTTLTAMGQTVAAEKALQRAAELDPSNADAHYALGSLFEITGRLDRTVTALEAALGIDPDHALARGQLHHARAQLCDWSDIAARDAALPELGISGGAVAPLPLLAMEDAPERQLLRATRFGEETFGTITPRPAPAAARGDRRLRVGYFSADFRSHPVARLIAGLLAAHDTSRVELFGYSFGPSSDDELRTEISGRFETFRDIRQMGDEPALSLVRGDELDVALDLTGYTLHSRTALLARRVAPVQVNYLGFPGTLGTGAMDYIVTDAVLVPPEERAHIAERMIVMPNAYQPNDDRRAVPLPDGDRAAHGLPRYGLVLCCFNNGYKITPREFDIWMRVMGQVADAVLWLLDPGEIAADNLRGAARQRGVDPARLVFAPRTGNAEHLARHRFADLFVDTFAYTAHTTASDALWMGLPVLTLAGRQFAARVGASLCTAAGVPELITHTEAEYEARLLELARDPAALANLRARLDAGRDGAPLFDTAGYARTFETALEAVHRRWEAGEAPQDLILGAGT